MRQSKSRTPSFETTTEFLALSDDEKERVYQEIDQEDPSQRLARSTPLSGRDLERHRRSLQKVGRPKMGKDGVKVISLSMEKQLLRRADAYAKRHGLKRSEFFSQAVRGALAKGA